MAKFPRSLPVPAEVLADALWRRQLRRALLAWYARNLRDLPWRRTRNPYHVWVSEIMLQQTQVATVIAYFERFLNAFPTITALAHAEEQQVLRLWEGLGYYRRARQMHRAAQLLVARHDGHFPQDRQAVRALPGIGRYTAGAILSIAFDAREPILEANTIRLLSRLIAYAEDPRAKVGQDRLWRAAEILLPRHEIGNFNQALMELGSLVCTPRTPLCEQCPLHALCPTRAAGLQATIPWPTRRIPYEEVHEAAVVVWHGRKVFLRRCLEGERWAGLWDFPRFPWPGLARKDNAPEALRLQTQAQTQTMLTDLTPWITMKHGVTRFRIQLTVFQAQCATKPPRRTAQSRQGDRLKQWVTFEQLPTLPLSVTGRKIAEQIAAAKRP